MTETITDEIMGFSSVPADNNKIRIILNLKNGSTCYLISKRPLKNYIGKKIKIQIG